MTDTPSPSRDDLAAISDDGLRDAQVALRARLDQRKEA